MKTLLFGKSLNINIEFLRYFIVGGISFVADFLLLYVFATFVDLHYLVANAIAFCVGLTINYILSITWVFPNRKLSCRKKEFTIFLLVGVVGLLLNELILWLLMEYMALYLMYSKIVATAVVFFWNFIARKILLF